MSDHTGIQWTDATWNPVVGCDRVSPGCDHCYAKQLHDQRHRAFLNGKKVAPQYAEPFETVQLMPERLRDVIAWRTPRRVFVNSVSDLFHADVPDGYLDRVFAVMALASRHTFQVLTKRAGRMRSYLAEPRLRERIAAAANVVMRSARSTRGIDDALAFRFTWRAVDSLDRGGWANKLSGIAENQWPLPNVWLGVSVENRATLSRIGALRQTAAAVRFISFEPLLEEVLPDLTGIHWAIVGGESGREARPFDVRWARALVNHCRAHDTAPFVKQLGRWVIGDHEEFRHLNTWLLSDGSQWVPGVVGEHNRSRPEGAVAFSLFDAHGGDIAEWPDDLRVREFPGVVR